MHPSGDALTQWRVTAGTGDGRKRAKERGVSFRRPRHQLRLPPDVGIDAPRRREVRICAFLVALFCLDEAALVEGFHVARVKLDGLVEVLDGAVELVFGAVGEAAVAVGEGPIRVELDGLV